MKKPVGHYVPTGFIIYEYIQYSSISYSWKLFAKLFLEKAGSFFAYFLFKESRSFFSKKREVLLPTFLGGKVGGREGVIRLMLKGVYNIGVDNEVAEAIVGMFFED